MIKKVSKTEAIRKRLQRQNKLTYLDQPEHMDAINRMNESLKLVRREYKVKERKSTISAAKVVLTS